MSTGLPATGTRRTARRKEILTAAIGIVSAEGCDALTMRRVAEELGMRAPSLYKHLRDKDELIAALQEHMSGAPSGHDDVSILMIRFVDNLESSALWTALQNRLFRRRRRD